MPIYIYRDTRKAIATSHGYVGEDIFTCEANNILDADAIFADSGLTFELQGKKPKTVYAKDGVDKLPFIAVRLR